MEVEAFFFNNNKLFKGIIDVGRWDSAEDVWKSCEEAMDGGQLFFFKIHKISEWRISKNIEYESYCYSKWSGSREVLDEFKKMKDTHGIAIAKSLLEDMIEENGRKFEEYLKQLKIK